MLICSEDDKRSRNMLQNAPSSWLCWIMLIQIHRHSSFFQEFSDLRLKWVLRSVLSYLELIIPENSSLKISFGHNNFSMRYKHLDTQYMEENGESTFALKLNKLEKISLRSVPKAGVEAKALPSSGLKILWILQIIRELHSNNLDDYWSIPLRAWLGFP